MCDPVSAGMFAINTMGSIGQHQAKRGAVAARNRQKLKQFDIANQEYLTQVMFDNNQYFDDVINYEQDAEKHFLAMTYQWSEYDAQLDKLFADSDMNLQANIIKMYESDYAGEQTGATAFRLAANPARELGFKKADETRKLISSVKEIDRKKGITSFSTSDKIDTLFEQIRHPPVHGHTPVPPELEAMPSSSSLMLDIAGSALTSFGMHKLTKAKPTGMKKINVQNTGFSNWELGTAVPEIPTLSDGTSDWSKAWSTN